MSDQTFFADRFRSFRAAQYGAADPSELPARQRLEAEDAFYAGASAGFCHGFVADFNEASAASQELRAFGARIAQRYEEAGLPLGQRRS